MILSNDEVNCITQTEVRRNYVLPVLIWKGIGKGYIPSKRAKKEEQIKLFVNKILIQYPPQY